MHRETYFSLKRFFREISSFVKTMLNWNKGLSLEEVHYLNDIKADTNIKRMFIFLVVLFVIQICNFPAIQTEISRYRQFYHIASLHTMGTCITYFLISFFMLKREKVSLERKKGLYFTFWYLIAIVSLIYNLGDMLDRRSVNNFMYLMVFISILPVFNIKELIIFLGYCISLQIIIVLMNRLPLVLILQCAVLCVFAIIISQILFIQFITSHIAKKQLQICAETDMLTDLLNRWGLEKWLEVHFDECEIYQYDVTLGVVDIDFFKSYNDKFGHIKGDECLRIISNCIKEVFSHSNHTTCRYGGEEFVIILINERDSVDRFEKLKEMVIAQNIPAACTLASDNVTVSTGVVHIKATENTTFDDIFHLADNALYEAKNSGRNKIISYSGQ